MWSKMLLYLLGVYDSVRNSNWHLQEIWRSLLNGAYGIRYFDLIWNSYW